MPIVNGGLTKNNASSLNNGLIYILKADGNILTPTISNTFTRATAAYSPETGALVASGNPRYVSGRAGQGIFIEEGTTNLLTNSNVFTSSWLYLRLNTTPFVTSQKDPYGGTSATNVVEDDTINNTHYIYQDVNKAASTLTYTLSVYAKRNNRNLGLRLSDTSISNSQVYVFDLTGNGTVSTVITGGTLITSPSATIIPVGNGYYRCSITSTVDSTITTVRNSIFIADGTSAANINYSGDNTSYVTIYGAQVEQKAYATSYQDSANATRNAETLTFNPTGVITPTQGTISAWVYVAAGGVWRDTTTSHRVFFTATADPANRISLLKSGGSIVVTTYNAAGVVTAHSVTTTLAVGWHMLSMTWDSAELALWIDGVKQASPVASPNIPSAVGTVFNIGHTGVPGEFANTQIDNFRIYNRVLSASEIMQLYRSGK